MTTPPAPRTSNGRAASRDLRATLSSATSIPESLNLRSQSSRPPSKPARIRKYNSVTIDEAAAAT